MHEISEEATTSPSARDEAPRSGPLAAMRGNRPLRLLFAGQVVSSLGDWLYITTLVVLVYRLTGSATIAALVTAARLVPYLIFLPLGGVLADRFDRRRLMIGADLGRAACMLALLAVHSPGTVWLAFPLAFASTCLFGVFRPALAATLPAVARDRDGLLQANALMGQIEGLSLVLGPSLAGLLLLAGAPRLGFAINALTYVVSALSLRALPSETLPSPEAAATSWRSDTLTGFRHLFRDQNGRLGAITLTTAALTAFSGAYWTITVVLADRNWHLGSQALGFINAAYGAGAILGTFLVARLARRLSPIIGYVVSLAGSAGAIALFGLSAPGAFPFIALGTFALIEMQNQVLGNTLIQTSTAPELLGRVFGAFEAIVVSAVVVGAVVAGPLIDLLGARTTTIVFAAAPVVALIVSLPKLLTSPTTSVAVQPTLV